MFKRDPVLYYVNGKYKDWVWHIEDISYGLLLGLIKVSGWENLKKVHYSVMATGNIENLLRLVYDDNIF